MTRTVPQVESENLMDKLLDAKASSDVESIITKLGNAIQWVPLGNNAGNYGIIGMGCDSYDGVTERITNSIDAIIELRVDLNQDLKTSNNPREVIKKIYNMQDGNLRYFEDQEIGRLSKDIEVKFLDSEDPKAPTIEIWDKGIGQHPIDFPNTLVGLNSDYKVSKFYLIGSFGQGGQTSFANCRYGIVISRKCPELLVEGQKDLIGWTIVRYRDPSTKDVIYKRGLYEYCIDSRTGRVLEAPPNTLRRAFEHGTLIRLVRYSMPKGTSDVLQPAGSAWGFLSQSLFDPVLPIRLYENRRKYQRRNRPLTGLAPRLWRGGKGEKANVSIHNSYDDDIGTHGRIRINYWGLKPVREPGVQTKWRDIKKGYVSGNSAVFITLNGQRHDVEQVFFLRDEVGLVYSYDYVIAQVECDGLTSNAKKDLISTTRDRLKEGEVKELLMQEVAVHLRNDRNLLAFERERKQEILNAKTQRDTSKIREIVGKYIFRNPELSELIEKTGAKEDEGIKQPKPRKEDDHMIDEQIPTSELEVPILKPVPTFLGIANVRDPILIEKGGNALIRLETDAEDSYLETNGEERLRCIHQYNLTRRKSISKLRSGKISYYVHCDSSTRVGSKEVLTFELELPDKSSLRVQREIVCIATIDREKEKTKTPIPEPNIQCVTRQDSLWGLLGYDDKSVGEVRIGVEDPAIIVSMENVHLREALTKRPMEETVIENAKNRYSAAIAYYLLLQAMDDKKRKGKLRKPQDDTEMSYELDRVAQTVSLLSLPMESL